MARVRWVLGIKRAPVLIVKAFSAMNTHSHALGWAGVLRRSRHFARHLLKVCVCMRVHVGLFVCVPRDAGDGGRL